MGLERHTPVLILLVRADRFAVLSSLLLVSFLSFLPSIEQKLLGPTPHPWMPPVTFLRLQGAPAGHDPGSQLIKAVPPSG